MATTLQQMVIGGQTMILNPSTDTDFVYKMVLQKFTPLGASKSIIQTMGMESGERALSGYLPTDASYRQLESTFRAMQPVACVDWLGNPFTALIVDMHQEHQMDIASDFQQVKYSVSLIRF